MSDSGAEGFSFFLLLFFLLDKYEGEWKDWEMHGPGTWTQAGDLKYVGSFKAGHSAGVGTFTWAGREFRDRYWEDADVLIWDVCRPDDADYRRMTDVLQRRFSDQEDRVFGGKEVEVRGYVLSTRKWSDGATMPHS